MAAARGALKKNATMLYTASQAFLRHPDVAATRANRDYVFKQVQEAIGGISSAAQASSPTDEKHGHTGIGELAAALNEFDVSSHEVFTLPLTLCLLCSPLLTVFDHDAGKTCEGWPQSCRFGRLHMFTHLHRAVNTIESVLIG